MSLGYVGPATLVIKDGVQVSVSADLERRAELPIEVFNDAGERIYAATHGWCGTLTAEGPIGDHGPLPLRLVFPGGGEADLWNVATDASNPAKFRVACFGPAPWSVR